MIWRITGATLIATLALSAPALAQEHALEGVVFSAETGQPLPGVTVVLPALDRVTVTDEEGFFSLGDVEEGRWHVYFYHLGYRTTFHVVDLQLRTRIGIELAIDPVLLPGIEASVDRLEVRRATAPYSVRAYEQSELITTSAFDALEFVTRREVRLRVGSLRSGTCYLVALGKQRCRAGGGLFGITRPRGTIVYIDERRAPFGLSQLQLYRPSDFYLIEVYGGGREIRAYTPFFIERMARGEGPTLKPVTNLVR